MQEKNYISKKQFRIVVSFALIMLCTTASLSVFVSSILQFLLFFLINAVSIRYVKNHRICWGIFAFSSAVVGEITNLLSQLLKMNIPTPAIFLFPASSFLFLTAPLFLHMMEAEETGTDIGYVHGFLFYLVNGALIASIREIFGADSVFGIKLGLFGQSDLQLLNHSSGAALLVLISILVLVLLKSNETRKTWVLDWERGERKKYQGLSFSREKRFFILMLCLLIVDVIAGGISALYVFYAPLELRNVAHIVLYATILTLGLFTLVVKAFHIEQEIDENRYLPLLSIVKIALPLTFYLRRLSVQGGELAISTFLIWWIALVIGVWFSFTIVLFYLHVLDRRLLFSKIPRRLEGIPFVILHILLALLIMMPILDVLQNV
ncbi:MAG: hypothetical protein IKG93_09335 [Clostridiales bacterium]|nr:hypothetical protein [Clostridiales bacterium]